MPGPGREIPGSASRGSRLRSGVDTQPGGPAADQCHRGRRATLWTPGQLGHLRQFLAARRPERPHQEPPRAIRSMGLLHFRRFADRAAADRRPGQYRSGAPTRAGPRVLAPKRTGGGPGDLERRSRRLPATAPRTNHGADCRGPRSQRDRSTRRHLCKTCGPDIERGPHSSPIGRPRHPHRQPGDAGGPDQPSRPCGSNRAAPYANPNPPRRTLANGRVASPRSDLLQRAGRIHP